MSNKIFKATYIENGAPQKVFFESTEKGISMDNGGTLSDALDAKVNAEEGKGLSEHNFSADLKEKLEKLESHPETHSADMINETADKRFLTANQYQKLSELADIRIGSGTEEGVLYLNITE